MTPAARQIDETRRGAYYALSCYIIWGLFPLYWYPLTHSTIGADQLLAQRIVWSSLFALLMVVALKQNHAFFNAFKQPKVLLAFMCSALAISGNWLLYLWAITHNHVLDTSLGYFISPLFSILLGRIFFNERINRIQTVAIGLALAGVFWLAIPAGHIPWIALGLTASFGIYGLLRKIASLPTIPALALETLMMLPFAAAYLLLAARHNELVFSELSPLQLAILLGSGMVTTIPLLLFGAGAKRISMSSMGIIQYLSPTCQLLLGLFLFQESFSLSRLIGYALVWLGVAVYILGIWHQSRHRPFQSGASSL